MLLDIYKHRAQWWAIRLKMGELKTASAIKKRQGNTTRARKRLILMSTITILVIFNFTKEKGKFLSVPIFISVCTNNV